jgi:hypothetical protein
VSESNENNAVIAVTGGIADNDPAHHRHFRRTINQ